MAITKRVMSKTKKIFLYGSGTLVSFFLILSGLYMYGVSVQTSGDIICSDTCISYFNISLKDYSICFGSTFKGVYTDPGTNLEIYKADTRYRNDNPNRWKSYNFTANKCLEKNKTYEFMLVGHKEPTQTIKWGLSLQGLDVDPFWYGIGNATANISATSLIMELGSQINISANLSGVSSVCVDIDHPSYGDNYSCGSPNAKFLFNITYFRNNQFNDSTTSKILEWENSDNKTVYIRQHQYDEIINVSINVSGFAYEGCYQESANTTNQSGTDGDCDLNYTGKYGGSTTGWTENGGTFGKLIDGDNTTYGNDGNAIRADVFYVNYSKPVSALSAGWIVHYDDPSYAKVAYELPIPDSCWNYNSQTLNLGLVSAVSNYYFNFTCQTDSGWEVVSAINMVSGGFFFYEEGVEWYFEETYPNVKIYINNSLSNDIGFVYSSGDITLDHFNDESTSKTLTYYEPETQTMYLHLPKNAVVSNARLNITGLYQQNATCFQESATLENSCGALSTGSYGDKTLYNSTWGHDEGYMLMNYTIPSSVVSSKWQVKHSRNPVIFANYTINSSCLRSDGKLNLAIKTRGAQQTYCFIGGCFDNSNNFIPLTSNYDCANVGYTSYVQSTWDRGHDSDYDSDIFYDWMGGGNPWKSGVGNSNAYNNATLWEEAVIWDYGYNISNPSIEVGIIDGVYEWNNSGVFNTTQRINNFSSSIMNYLANCEADENGFCEVPVYISVPQSPGMILLDSIEINYEDNPNPIYLNSNLIQYFLNHSSGFADIPIKFVSSKNGTLQIDSISFDYAGGNDTISVLVYNVNKTGWCYQESANIATSCGGLSSGEYEEYNLYDGSAGYDGDWDTYTSYDSDLENGTLWINYTKPSGAFNTSLWRVGDCGVITNLTINANCWSQSIIQFRAISGINAFTYWDCYNGSSWINLRASDCGMIDEEEMIWNKSGITDKSNNATLNITNYYSKWDYKLPSYVSWLEFIPKSPTAKSVMPYGQTTSRPIFNITNYGYGGKNSNFSVYLNETYTCVNLTISTTNNKTNGFLLNNTWRNLFNNFNYLNSTSLWMWADYNCNYTTWKLWEPDLSFRNCCKDCICSEDLE